MNGGRWIAGLLALAFYAAHCAGHILRGEWQSLLWLSNVATLVLAAGCLLGRARPAALAFLWLALSAVLWVLDVAIAGAPIDTAVLTHLGSFALATLAVRSLGVPRGTWCLAAGGLVALVGISRLVTDRRHNVNLAFAVADGWEAHLANHGAYLGALLVLGLALFFVVERLARLASR
jgi:hypothetical protein